MVGKILGALGKPIATAVGAWQARKRAEVEGRAEIEKARIDYKVARFRAKADRLRRESENAASYDMQVLRNRQHTWVDEFIVVVTFLIVILNFVPALQPYMKAGWDAVSAAPFWFEFLLYVVIISTLGGMMVLRILVGSGVRSSLRSSPSNTPQETEEDDSDSKKTTAPSSQPSRSKLRGRPFS